MRRFLIAAALAAAASLPGHAKAQAVPKATLDSACSGLPWPSGGSAGLGDLYPWRGRDLDVRTIFTAKETWPAIAASAASAKNHVGKCGKIVVSVSMLPKSHRGRLGSCAVGRFDGFMRQLGVGLVTRGAAQAIVRLGYEANLDSFPWAITGDGQGWARCYRRWVDVLRSVPGQGFSFIWNMNGRGQWSNKNDIARVWPGDDYVDYVGVDYYDSCPAIRSQADWDWRVNRKMRSGSPDGIGAWLAFAKARGKKLAVPEWGIGGPQGCPVPGYDNPLFIQNMRAFFAAHAADIAYEALFNGRSGDDPAGYRLNPTTVRTQAAAAYLEGWGPGAPTEPPPAE